MTRASTSPLAAGITLTALTADPHPLLHRLRAAEPAAWIPALDGWLITRYDLAVQVMRDARRFTVDHPSFSTAQIVGPSMLSLDGDAHRRHRTPFEPPFRRRAVAARFETPLASHIDQRLDSLAARGTAELRRDYAGPVAVETMRLALGLNAIAATDLLQWYDAIVEAVNDVTAGAGVAQSGRTAYKLLHEALHTSLHESSADSLLAAVKESASGLDDGAILANAAILLFGGIETTEGMIANALYHLLTTPAALRALLDDAELMPAVVEESLRLEPAAAVVDRYATTDVELAGALIRRNDLVRVSLSAANRDPAVFPDPDRFDPQRPNLATHVAFAQGPHVCLGLHLARLEAQLAIARCLARLPNLRLFNPAAARPYGLVFRKPRALDVVWGE